MSKCLAVWGLLLSLVPLTASAMQCRLTITPPLVNANGTALLDLAGFRVYTRAADGQYEQGRFVREVRLADFPNPNDLTVTVPCEVGHYLAVSAIDQTANESTFSNEIFVSVDSIPPAEPGIVTAVCLPDAAPLPLPIQAVTASANDAGYGPEHTIDGDLTTRWSALGLGQWVQYQLATPAIVTAVRLAWYLGNTRTALYSVQGSLDGTEWTALVSLRRSSGTTAGLETVPVTPPQRVQYVRVVGNGNSVSQWNSLAELELIGVLEAP